MLAKKTKENDESLEDTMDKSSDIFDTPRARCLKLKTEFLRRARDYKFWGHDNSRQRVIALDTLWRYCRQSIELAEWGTELRKDVDTDIESFLLEEHVLPVPRSIRAKLKGEFASTGSQTQGVAFMMAVIEELRTNSLAEFEKEEWSEKEEFYQYSFALRELRKKIYTPPGGKWVSRGHQSNLHFLSGYMEVYEEEVNQFLKRFKKMLSKREVCIWKKKLQDTNDFAASETNRECLMTEEEIAEARAALSEADENTSKSDTVQEKLENHVPVETLEDKSVVPQVNEIFEAAKKQELLVENLPNVPADTEGLFDNHNSVDENIEARLLQLKFFRKTWCSEELTDQTEPKKEAPPDVVSNSKPKRKSEVAEVPTYTTKEEADNFNDWYLQRIRANSNTFTDALKVEVQANKVEQDETPTPVSGAFMDEEVDRDHTKELPSPCTRNLFQGSTCPNSNPYLNTENMLVLLFAILKLINFSYPKLSNVPAVFPTQPQPHPDQDTSVPSSAYGPTLASMERSLPRTSSMQVVTKGYLSWLCDTVRERLQRGKISVGLRFIEFGETLLAH